MSVRSEVIIESFYSHDEVPAAIDAGTYWPDRGKTIGLVTIEGPDDCAALLRAVEAGLRAGLGDVRLQDWRIELMNMRHRAAIEEWGGWQ